MRGFTAGILTVSLIGLLSVIVDTTFNDAPPVLQLCFVGIGGAIIGSYCTMAILKTSKEKEVNV